MDKGHEDVMTLQELHELVQHYSGTLKYSDQYSETPRKSSNRKRPFSVPSHFSRTPAKSRRGREAFLKDVIVYFSDYGEHGKEKLEMLAQELGATVHMNPSKRIHFILGADRANQNLQRMAFDGKYDIVSVEWLLKCHEADRRLPLRPQDYLQRSTKVSCFSGLHH